MLEQIKENEKVTINELLDYLELLESSVYLFLDNVFP